MESAPTVSPNRVVTNVEAGAPDGPHKTGFPLRGSCRANARLRDCEMIESPLPSLCSGIPPLGKGGRAESISAPTNYPFPQKEVFP